MTSVDSSNPSVPNSGKKMQYRKTKYCPWHDRGRCYMGDTCNYAHGRPELRPKPNLFKTKLCPESAKGVSCTKLDCRFAHDFTELQATSAFFKTKLCKFWLKGNCPAGMECRHAHGPEELRSPEGHEEAGQYKPTLDRRSKPAKGRTDIRGSKSRLVGGKSSPIVPPRQVSSDIITPAPNNLSLLELQAIAALLSEDREQMGAEELARLVLNTSNPSTDILPNYSKRMESTNSLTDRRSDVPLGCPIKFVSHSSTTDAGLSTTSTDELQVDEMPSLDEDANQWNFPTQDFPGGMWNSQYPWPGPSGWGEHEVHSHSVSFPAPTQQSVSVSDPSEVRWGSAWNQFPNVECSTRGGSIWA